MVENTSHSLRVNQEYCKGCGLCVGTCPKRVLGMAEGLNTLGYHPVEIVNPEECTACGICYLMCPDLVFQVKRG